MSSSVSVAKPSMVCLCVCVCVNFGEKGLCIFVLFFIFWVLFCLAFSPFSPCPFSSSPSNFQRPLFYIPSYHLKSNVFLKTATANHVLLKVHSVQCWKSYWNVSNIFTPNVEFLFLEMIVDQSTTGSPFLSLHDFFQRVLLYYLLIQVIWCLSILFLFWVLVLCNLPVVLTVFVLLFERQTRTLCLYPCIYLTYIYICIHARMCVDVLSVYCLSYQNVITLRVAVQFYSSFCPQQQSQCLSYTMPFKPFFFILTIKTRL